MNAADASLIIAGAGVVLSLVLSLTASSFISGSRAGRNDNRLDTLETNMDKMATKEQLAGVKEDLAEIKGMFRMTLRNDPDGR